MDDPGNGNHAFDTLGFIERIKSLHDGVRITAEQGYQRDS